MKLKSYWLDTSTPFSAGASHAPHGTADVVVVGGGFTGLSAALALAKKNAKVVVLEAERVANAASGRNGGMCNIDSVELTEVYRVCRKYCFAASVDGDFLTW